MIANGYTLFTRIRKVYVGQMNYANIIKNLISYPREANWFEFKTNWYEPAGIGEYISSLSNAAALEGQAAGYLVWGVKNNTHEIVGTTFDYTVDVKNEPLEHYLARQIYPDITIFHSMRFLWRKNGLSY